ncbi:hypothetical protein K458DRAFT_166519 [Lentithecium fluviatile CBS 122367]|uniref:Uncharacterized protein n=1 Tax=Lentithecium fluviatile CBS 122367 TaxID=1168545 RepID=A0A6G1IFH4_9PLEO|nr:hypothetical protein K458DRAFT_166519 [Lentithecium fluviatile CBS 122367]
MHTGRRIFTSARLVSINLLRWPDKRTKHGTQSPNIPERYAHKSRRKSITLAPDVSTPNGSKQTWPVPANKLKRLCNHHNHRGLPLGEGKAGTTIPLSPTPSPASQSHPHLALYVTKCPPRRPRQQYQKGGAWPQHETTYIKTNNQNDTEPSVKSGSITGALVHQTGRAGSATTASTST